MVRVFAGDASPHVVTLPPGSGEWRFAVVSSMEGHVSAFQSDSEFAACRHDAGDVRQRPWYPHVNLVPYIPFNFWCLDPVQVALHPVQSTSNSITATWQRPVCDGQLVNAHILSYDVILVQDSST